MSRRLISRLLIALAGSASLALLGYMGVSYSGMGGVTRLSYDLPFRWRGHIDVSEAHVIYMDEKSATSLQQGSVWSRSLHAQLLDRLHADGAKAVFFDVVFAGASEDPSVDETFASSIKQHGNVFLGGALDISSEGGQYLEQITSPTMILRKAAAGWGLLVFRPIDPDYGVREIYMGTEQKASAVWVAAQKLGASLPDSPEERDKQRWLNYYGPHGWLKNVSYMSALSTVDTPPGFFKDKIVFVGGRTNLGPLSLGKDEFATPYVRWRLSEKDQSRHSPGVDIHATALLNLLRGEWLTRLPMSQEQTLVIICGIFFGILFSFLRPTAAVLTGLLSAALFTCAAFWLTWEKHLWFSWIVPVGLQIPLGITWSLGTNYLLETRRRSALRRAFGHYLSPQMADRISNSEFDLRPGGKVVEASVMFTDLEGFTSLSESLGDPEKLSEVLTEYFTRTTGHVLQNDGTIVKFIGDAVLAVWGAPVADSNHASKAALAAQRLHVASQIDVGGRSLRTRIGIHTGLVLAGNLGSAQRFDYTVIGDGVNFASRLEGLNKYLGTDILISEATRDKLVGRFVTRKLGAFKVVGKTTSVTIYELLPELHQNPPEWITDFEAAVDAFRAGDIDTARAGFERVISIRGSDGPSGLYLQKIAESARPVPADWSGVIEVLSK